METLSTLTPQQKTKVLVAVILATIAATTAAILLTEPLLGAIGA